VVLVYTLYGGMWSVAMTDFVQMIVMVRGPDCDCLVCCRLAGGAGKVVDLTWPHARASCVSSPQARWRQGMLFFFAAAITMMLGSIPQQDVFQRVMSSRDSASTAAQSAR
jgi:SSS family solute:Na+ symporter